MTEEKDSTLTTADQQQTAAPEAKKKGAPRATVKSLRAEIEALQQQLAQCNERLLRKAAEFDNYKKRTARTGRGDNQRQCRPRARAAPDTG